MPLPPHMPMPTEPKPMELARAKDYAEKILKWIEPYVVHAEVAGSIRRECAECADVDIVCIPKFKNELDMFQEVTASENLLRSAMANYVQANKGTKIVSGLERGAKQMIIELKKCQLDLWFASANDFATRLLCRTGSKEHNIWLIEHAKTRAKKWAPYEGVYGGGYWRGYGTTEEEYIDGTLMVTPTERDIYAALDLPYIEPKDRNAEFLAKHYGE